MHENDNSITADNAMIQRHQKRTTCEIIRNCDFAMISAFVCFLLRLIAGGGLIFLNFVVYYLNFCCCASLDVKPLYRVLVLGLSLDDNIVPENQMSVSMFHSASNAQH